MVVKYVEDRNIDWERIASFLKLSAHLNHWTNFGPVSRLLEQRIHNDLKLSNHLSVIVCCNATIALNTLIEMHNQIHDRNLRWVVSSYGFYCTIQGPLRDAEIVDCNSEGLLDLNLLKNDDYDGIIATNVFGLRQNLEEYHQFCRQHKKICIVDAATAYTGIQHGPNEIISFHQTKPWGFGEGGCVIVERKNENLFRSLINFGIRGKEIDRRATNGKLSDPASALILQRLEDITHLAHIYREQYQRIIHLAQNFDYTVMNDVSEHPGIPPNVPLICEHPIYDFSNPYIDLRKYYQPLANTPKAQEIYSHILNFPCHPGIQNVSDKEIKETFNFIRKREKNLIKK